MTARSPDTWKRAFSIRTKPRAGKGRRDLSEVRLFINFVGTADAYKRQGVATKIVQAAEEWGRERSAVVALCDTFIDSPVSVPFWERRMGYERRAIIFRKRLD
jgi:GNAT superfamily N-acetyltransferase